MSMILTKKRIFVICAVFLCFAICGSFFAQAQTITTLSDVNSEQENSITNGIEINAEPISESMRSKMGDILQSANPGNDYWVTFPPNDYWGGHRRLVLYVVAPKAGTPIYLTIGGIDIDYRIIQEDFGGYTYGDPFSYFDSDRELKQIGEDSVVDKGIHVYTDGGYEIFVYIAHYVDESAVGYAAIPTSGLGNNYIHCSYYDAGVMPWKTGFAVICVEPNTQVQVKLKSTFPDCITFNGQKVGGLTLTSPIMQPGQVWTVMNGYAQNLSGSCDFTGSIVSSDKNFGIISFVQRTAIPVGEASRDALCQQLLPTNKWGRKHVSVQFKGEYETKSIWNNYPTTDPKEEILNQNPGQIFRIVAKEPNTEITAKWYDLKDLEQYGEWTTMLPNEGDWAEFRRPYQNAPPINPFHSIFGACYWEANKPVQIMMYQPTVHHLYQNGTKGDPLMIKLIPFEQYGQKLMFQTPPTIAATTTPFSEHYITLYAEGPKLANGLPDENPTNIAAHLSTIKVKQIIGKNITDYLVKDKDTKFYSQRIPGTNYYFARWELVASAYYYIIGELRMSGTVYGFGNAISYGWNTSMKLFEQKEYDSLPPEIVQTTAQCITAYRPSTTGRVRITQEWFDTTNIDTNYWNYKQVDQGISKAPEVLFNLDNNLELYRYHFLDKDGEDRYPPSVNWRFGDKHPRGLILWNVVNPFSNADAIIKFEDGAGNITLDTIHYYPGKIQFLINDSLPIETFDFGNDNAVGNTYTKTIYIQNISDSAIVVNCDSIFLKDNKFQIVEGGGKVVLALFQRHKIIISYTPQNTSTISDKLYVYTDCLYYELPISGGSTYIADNPIPSFAVVPNPTSSKITIIADISGESVVEIMDLAGDVVYSMTRNPEGEFKIEIDMSDFITGTYFVRLTNGKKVSVEKLLKK